METGDVVTLLSSISIGTVIAWIVVLGGIVSAISTATIKLYKTFEKTHEIKEENDDFKKMVKAHDVQLTAIQTSIENIQEKIDRQEQTEMKKLKYSLVRAMEEYVAKGAITIRQLKSLEDNFEEYHSHHGNGYVTTMMKKVRTLPVIGMLDDDGNDID